MILFGMAVGSGVMPSSVLVPSTPRRNRTELPKRVRELILNAEAVVHAGIDVLAHQSEERRATQAWQGQSNDVSTSDTYGPDDPFTILWVLELLYQLAEKELPGRLSGFVDAANSLVDRVYSNPEFFVLRRGDCLDHVFPLLRVIHIDCFLRKHELTRGEPDVSKLLRRLQNKIHLHLSYSSIPDSSFDPAELAFAMEAVLQLAPDALDQPLVDRCFDVLQAAQKHSSYWRPLRPFIANQQGLALLPLSVEIASSLVRTCEILDGKRTHGKYSARFMGAFQSYARWLFSRMVRGKAQTGESFTGWHSEHVDDPGKIHTWETSQVLLYLIHYQALIRRHMADKSLELANFKVASFNGAHDQAPLKKPAHVAPPKTLASNVVTPPAETPNDPADSQKPPLKYWRENVLIREPLRGFKSDSEYAVYNRILRDYLQPRFHHSAVSQDKHYSMLLYGPQGTGKTSVAEELANALGRELITITPSNFTEGGESGVEARAKALFDVLIAQNEKVIIFDEIDSLILDRDSKLYNSQGDIFKFMTPGMLTKLRDLRRAAKSIFIVSTNFEERIDQAIKRPGRIDDQYLLLPPDSAQRRRIIESEIRDRADSGSVGPFEEDNNLDHLDWKRILEQSALLVFDELRNVVAAALRTTPQRTLRAFEGTLIERLRGLTPSIRLVSYGPRFSWQRNQIQTVQEPYKEFFLLVYLVLESGRSPLAEERRLLRVCAQSLAGESQDAMRTITDAVEEHIKNPVLSNKIGEWIAAVR
ncbi:MAG: ATP-binding protein [Terriglobales bacterium]